MTDRFADVRKLFEQNLADGTDLGAAFCVTVEASRGDDLYGGFADEARTRPWRADTIVGVYSTTKTMAALTALLVADRGELDFAAPVARYWPEFAAAGKADVTVAQVMSHSSGLCGWREPITSDDLYDWEKATALLAAQEPYWEPGTASGYHVLTQGYLIGEVIRRITGRTLGTVFREEIAEPLGADFHIGLPAAEDHRVADLIPPVDGRRRAVPSSRRGGGRQSRAGPAGHPYPAVAGRGDPGRRRHRQCPGGGRDPRDHGERRRFPGPPLHVRGRLPAGAGRAGRRCGSGARDADALRPRLRPRRGTHAERQHRLLGRLRRFAGHHRPGRAHDDRLRNEPDDRHEAGDLRALELAMAFWEASAA